MDRTRRIVARVTASLLLAGLAPPGSALGQPPQAQSTPERGEAKSDPAVAATADAIAERLKGTSFDQAKTKAEIVKQFPTTTPAVIDQALAQLVYDGRVKTRGDGSANNPFLYYDRQTHTG